MQMTVAMEGALAQVAWRCQVDEAALRAAIMHESAAELAAVLGLEPQVAQAHMARIARAVTVQSDVGAGCMLLTDEVQQQVVPAHEGECEVVSRRCVKAKHLRRAAQPVTRWACSVCSVVDGCRAARVRRRQPDVLRHRTARRHGDVSGRAARRRRRGSSPTQAPSRPPQVLANVVTACTRPEGPVRHLGAGEEISCWRNGPSQARS